MSRMLRATSGASSSCEVNPTQLALISPRMYVSSPEVGHLGPRMKSAVQINGLVSKGPSTLSMASSSFRKGVTSFSHFEGWSYRYLAPGNRPTNPQRPSVSEYPGRPENVWGLNP
eukprot:1195374-Prorocentrum_minimum.AAC.9